MNSLRKVTIRSAYYLHSLVDWGYVARVSYNMAGASGKYTVMLFSVFYWLLFLHSTIADCNVSFAPPENGFFVNDPETVSSGGFLGVSCNENYTANGIDSFYCQMNFFLPNVARMAVCRENCADPGIPEFGIRLTPPTEPYDMYTYSTTVHFECGADTLLEGAPSITCGEGGQWSAPRPICRLNCQDPGSPANGRQEPNGIYTHGGQVRFTCDDGTLVGSDLITCADGNWSHPLPFCGAVIIHSTELVVTSGEDLVAESINNITVNVKVTSSSLGTDISGTGLWKMEIYVTNDSSTKYIQYVPTLTSEQKNQALIHGGTMNFNDIDYSVDGGTIPCTGELQLCVEVQKGDSPSVEFDLQAGLNNYALKACQTIFCDVNECLDVSTCSLPNQQCVNFPGSYNCTCVPGYEGVNCDAITNNCQPNLCQNGATCQNDVNVYTCECPFAFEGNHCESQTDFCDDDPCQNNSTCETSLQGFQCHCQLGYQGNNCNTTVPYFTACQQSGTIEFILPDNSSSVLVSLDVTAQDWLQRPLQVDNVDPTLSLPGVLEFSESFMIGKEVTLKATDENGNTAECSVFIKLTDLEAPKIICPDDVDMETYRKSDLITWPPAVATDNVGLHSPDPIVYNRPNASEVTSNGKGHIVTATANDTSGNVASCNFTVILRRIGSGSTNTPLSAIIAGSIVGTVALIILVVMICLLVYFRKLSSSTPNTGTSSQQRNQGTRRARDTRSFQQGNHEVRRETRSFQQPQYFENNAYENNHDDYKYPRSDPRYLPSQQIMRTVTVHDDGL
ncbi:uncharacterized protein LOC144437709 [Glandiceps talaboti]